MTEKTYEMMWDCEYCGTKKLLGKTHRFCAECGAPQNPEKRYFPPDDEKVAVEDHQFVGADVHCPACQEPQSAAVKHCANCGSPLQGGKAAARQADQVVGPDGQLQQPPQAAQPGAAPEKKSSKAGCIIGVIAVVIVGVIAFFVVNRFWTKEASLEVTKLSWRREIKIETYDTHKESGPCKDMPKGADLIKKSKPKEVCKTRKIDQGDGTFKEKKECKTPPAKCDYEVAKWKVTKTLKEEGDADEEPKWPKSSYKKNKSKNAKVGDKAEGDRVESYIVQLKDTKSGDEHDCVFSSKSKWKKFEKGSKWKGETGMLTDDLKCDKLKKM
jgi:hypothetical protein